MSPGTSKLTEGELERGEAWDDVHDVRHLRLDFTDYAGWTRGRSTETQFGLELRRMVPGLKRLRRKTPSTTSSHPLPSAGQNSSSG